MAAIPLGGYVKMLDEREGPVPSPTWQRSFTRKPPWQRILVLLAGPAFNILFAIVVLWGMFWWQGATEPSPSSAMSLLGLRGRAAVACTRAMRSRRSTASRSSASATSCSICSMR